jgi:hypothetical protein
LLHWGGGNPADGVERPAAANGNEGRAPARGDGPAREPLDAPVEDTLERVH